MAVSLALRGGTRRLELLLGHGAQIAKVDVGGRKLLFLVMSISDRHGNHASAGQRPVPTPARPLHPLHHPRKAECATAPPWRSPRRAGLMVFRRPSCHTLL